MLNINIKVLKCIKDNATTRSMIFQNFREGRFFQDFRDFRKNEISRNVEREMEDEYGSEGHSTSPPCGNLVDSSPRVRHTETIG